MEAALRRPWCTPSNAVFSALPDPPKLSVGSQRSSEHGWNQKKSATRRRRRGARGCRAAPSGDVEEGRKVRSPPREYDYRADTSGETRETVQRGHPELMDLVEDGTLVVVKRPPQYVERRSDGYLEPEVVYIVGTTHLSRLSADQVTRVINSVHPDNVVIELCRSRAGIMYDEPAPNVDAKPGSSSKSNLMTLSGDSFGSAVGRSFMLGGQSALALRLLLAGVSERLSKSAGVATGEEFRAARKAAEGIGAQIILGDRPIEITLQRAWRSLRWDERFRFAVTLLQGMSDKNLDVSEECLRALKSDDALSAMFGELSSRFPSLPQPLIHERDMVCYYTRNQQKTHDMYNKWDSGRGSAHAWAMTLQGGVGAVPSVVDEAKQGRERRPASSGSSGEGPHAGGGACAAARRTQPALQRPGGRRQGHSTRPAPRTASAQTGHEPGLRNGYWNAALVVVGLPVTPSPVIVKVDVNIL